MFAKSSRYHQLPAEVTTDTRGRLLKSKALRPLPDSSGTFRHIVEEGDRLEHLTYKYYDQPQKWWRICDANPEFMSPQALLGQEPIVVEQFPLTIPEETSPFPWSHLLRLLSSAVGVVDVQAMEEARVVPEKIDDQQMVIAHKTRFERAVLVTYNQINISSQQLAFFMEQAGCTVGSSLKIGRVGQQIIIPPADG